MRMVQTAAECRRAVAESRAPGRRIGFVPTMGGLHAGHVSLIEAARAAGEVVVVSIFVNPTQFGPGEDFTRYPRPIEQDRAICERSGCDLLFVPEVTQIYPPGDETRVRPGPLADRMCGPFRPGHFEGVCTVVARLFSIVQPDVAYFGQKDAQQAVILRRMTTDLCFPIEIRVCPIVREPDGLACSTRNAYLSAAEREQATSLYRSLCTGRDLIAGGERRPGRVVATMRRVLDDAGVRRIDYITVADPATLVEPDEIRASVMLALAARIGPSRLIDNLPVDAPAR